MQNNEIQNSIEYFWDKKQSNSLTDGEKKEAIKYANDVINMLDNGSIKIAEKTENLDKYGNKIWKVNQWVKKAVLLSFLNENLLIEDGNNKYYDKCKTKFDNWTKNDFKKASIRVVKGAFVRKGAFFDNGTIIMPSFVNIGANIGKNTMIDSMTTIGSCCQIGDNCHISANVCIGGVLEPLQANPVIIEDNCFIGAGSQITEGIIIREGSIIASGVILSSGVKIINRETGEITQGEIPPYSVVVAGTYQTNNNLSINCAVIIKKITPEIRKKTSINDLLR